MHVLGIVGLDSDRAALVDRLTERLGRSGAVATVRRLPDPPDAAPARDDGATTTCGISDDGWFAVGEERSLDATLDDLAPDHDYAVLEGFAAADVPTVAVGGADHVGPTVAAAETADGVDLDAVVEALRDAEPHVTLSSLVDRAKRSPDAERSGAIATFTGRVRARDGEDDAPTKHLEFETYEGVAGERMEAIRSELEEREGVLEVLLHHRTGIIEYGEDIVFVVVLAGHRREAFRTVEDGIDRLKDEVPIFKKEVTIDEEFWVHDRP